MLASVPAALPREELRGAADARLRSEDAVPWQKRLFAGACSKNHIKQGSFKEDTTKLARLGEGVTL